MNKPCNSSHGIKENGEFYVNIQRPNSKALVGITDARILIAECLKCPTDIREHCNKGYMYFRGLMMNSLSSNDNNGETKK